MKSKPYDVVLLPDADLQKSFILASENLRIYDVHFTLDQSSFFPHLSLYMLQLNEAGLNNACELLETIKQHLKPIVGRTKEYHYENCYLDIEYERVRGFETAQEQVIETLNPLRDGLRERDNERLATATEEERFNILTYGYRSVGKSFAPHVTFTRFREDQFDAINILPDKEVFNGMFVSLGIFEMGNNGTCVRKIKTWDLE